MLLKGGGAETLQDRGSLSHSSNHTLNPYFNNNFIARWQEYTRWYMTSWEAKKIIDIPVDDALRKPVEMVGLDEHDHHKIMEMWSALDCDRQIRRALIQERLLGAALIVPVFLCEEGEPTDCPLCYESIRPGDLQAFNVIDISRLSRPDFDGNPLSPDYDKIEVVEVSGVPLHRSRMCILDGDALFNRQSQTLLENFRMNPAGFGNSKLDPLYDLLNRVEGTQQGAYHLVNMASCLLIEADNLRSVIAADSPVLGKLKEITEQLSIYRGAIIDAKGARISQHAASFGAVPELIMTFAQLLAAASDIPATRFLGQAPGGLNATGESDQTNYYDMVESIQHMTLKPIQRKMIDWIGASLWGWSGWCARSENLELQYPDLKSMTEHEKVEIARTRSELIRALVQEGLIGKADAVNELLAHEIFKTDVEVADFFGGMDNDSFELALGVNKPNEEA